MRRNYRHRAGHYYLYSYLRGLLALLAVLVFTFLVSFRARDYVFAQIRFQLIYEDQMRSAGAEISRFLGFDVTAPIWYQFLDFVAGWITFAPVLVLVVGGGIAAVVLERRKGQS